MDLRHGDDRVAGSEPLFHVRGVPRNGTYQEHKSVTRYYCTMLDCDTEAIKVVRGQGKTKRFRS